MLLLVKKRLTPVSFVIIRAMSTGYHAQLIPSKENLDLLQNVDLFSSFNDSSQDIVHVDTDSDDPFDPADLVGLDESWSKLLTTAPVKSIEPAVHLAFNWQHNPSPKHNLSQKQTLRRPSHSHASHKPSQASLHNHRLFSPKREQFQSVPFISPSNSLGNDPLIRAKQPKSPQAQPKSPRLKDLIKPVLFNSPEKTIEQARRTKSEPISAEEPTSVNASSIKQEDSVKQEAEENSLKRPWFMLLPKKASTIRAPEKLRTKPLTSSTIQLATQIGHPATLSQDGITSSTTKVVKPILLSREQEYVRQLSLQGKSMFFTGSAGTGKSVLLRQIIKDLKARHGPGTVAVTASTGLAAYNIGGITVHSFAGVGLAKGDLTSLIKMVRKNRKVLRRWRDTKVLIIDEISMIDGRLFDNLDSIAREVRRKNRHLPFGGIQVIVCGDFYQLPPVSKAQINPNGTETKEQALFSFESDAWRTALKSSIILKEVFRQKGDQTFIDMLNELRHGKVSPAAESEFRRLSRPLECPHGIVPTELYSTRYEVENANNMKLVKLNGKAKLYEARDGGSLPPEVRAAWLSNFLAPKKLFLKENAQVMCIKNFDETLVNGSLGRVKGFVDRDTYLCRKIVLENPDYSIQEVEKLFAKHRVAYDLSQKTSQSVLVDDVTEDMLKEAPEQLDNVFNFLHEDRNFSSLLSDKISQTDTEDGAMTTEQAIQQNKRRKLEFINKVEQLANGDKYPLVEFASPDGLSSRTVLVEPERWDITDEVTEEVLVSRTQLPLMLAWAMSIHKSQGQTLPKVRVDLSRIFENGQAYVALSRAVSRDGLQVVNFRTDRVRTHEVVERFYETLSTTEDLAKQDAFTS